MRSFRGSLRQKPSFIIDGGTLHEGSRNAIAISLSRGAVFSISNDETNIENSKTNMKDFRQRRISIIELDSFPRDLDHVT
jgi:hypothetical protein